MTCGQSLIAEGCFGSGSLGPFGSVGCIIEGLGTTYRNVVTRAVYVVDVSSGDAGNGVALYRYLQTDTIAATTGTDTVTVALTKTGQLPLIGAPTAICNVAGNANFLYVGTDQESSVV